MPLVVGGCSKTYDFESTWRDRPIVVDGDNEDWDGITSYVEEAKISVGLLNDDHFLYVNLVLWEPTQHRQAIGQGLTLWFDPEGGGEKTLGVRYPLGRMMGGSFRGGPYGGGEPGGDPPGARPVREDPEEVREKSLETANELEVLGPRNIDRHRYAITDAGGVEVRVNPTQDSLIYELKVPLHKGPGEKFALGVAAGEPIGVTLETPKLERPQMSGGPPGRGGGGRPPGGRPGGAHRSPPDPLEVKAKIRLAAAPTSPVAPPAPAAPRGS
jgi:hypothetical protein